MSSGALTARKCAAMGRVCRSHTAENLLRRRQAGRIQGVRRPVPWRDVFCGSSQSCVGLFLPYPRGVFPAVEVIVGHALFGEGEAPIQNPALARAGKNIQTNLFMVA
jgi:hypothetical protein